jgi:hypothetical protein
MQPPAQEDEITLALLYLTTFKDKYGLRAWKSHSWDVLDRLRESGHIHDPATKAKSVMLTDEGAERSKRLFEKAFHARVARRCAVTLVGNTLASREFE